MVTSKTIIRTEFEFILMLHLHRLRTVKRDNRLSNSDTIINFSAAIMNCAGP
jgi:hypothetical protein